MARTNNLTNFLTDVATAIKTKKGDDTPIPASDFDTEIIDLPSGGGTHDWSAIGYSGEPSDIGYGYDYAVQIKNNWTLNTNFNNDTNLIYMPLVNTTGRTNFGAMFNSCSSLTTVPQLDTSSGTTFNNMFSNCINLRSVPQLDTSQSQYMNNMYAGCKNIIIPIQVDISNAKQLNSLFMYCNKVPKITLIGSGNNLISLRNVFQDCEALTELTMNNINTSNVTDFYCTFSNCKSLVTLPAINMVKANTLTYFCNNINLENLGGFIDLGANYETSQSANYDRYTLYLTEATKLTHTSLMNIINNLYDIATKGCNTQKLRIGNTNIAKLTAEEIAIATNKGWTVA